MLQLESFLQNRYLIRAVLGKGGMGAVYLAIDQTLNKKVAVKENLYSTPEYNRQFKIEAQIMANIHHKNLPKVYDYFEIPNQGQYMVMDYIEGEDLRQRLERKGTLDNEDAIMIALAICDALEYLHNLNPPIIHRDIKPGNIKVDESGNVFLVDFGLAKIYYESQLTATGARAMTPGYSPPEQYGTARTDERSDIYSLGATLYAVLSSVLPEDSLAIAMEQTDLTPLRARNLKVTVSLARIVEKCLETHPEDRFQTINELRESLLKASKNTRKLRSNSDIVVEPPEDSKPITFDFFDEQHSTNKILYSTDSTKHSTILSPNIDPNSASLARRKKIAKQKRKKKNKQIIYLLITILLIIYVGYAGITTDWSLNKAAFIMQQKYIATTTNIPTLTNIPISTPTPIETPNAEPTITKSAVILPSSTNTSTSIISPSNTPISTKIPTLIQTQTSTPTFQPTPFAGNNQFLYVSDQSGENQIWIDSINHNEIQQQITYISGGACQPAWSPDGGKIAFISPCKKPNNIFFHDTHIFILDLNTGDFSTLLSDSNVFSPKWSPNGEEIMFSKLVNEYVIDIYKIDLNSGLLTKLVENLHQNLNPNWYPDQEKIIYVTNKIDAYRIMEKETDLLAESIELSKEIGAEHNYPIITLDGNRLLFTSKFTDSYPRLKYIDLSEEKYLENGTFLTDMLIPQTQPSLSSDGNWILFTTWQAGNFDIYIMNSNGAGIQQIKSSEYLECQPAWKP
jgi:serine/threonine protein kinase